MKKKQTKNTGKPSKKQIRLVSTVFPRISTKGQKPQKHWVKNIFKKEKKY
jgi:hypothetical protein